MLQIFFFILAKSVIRGAESMSKVSIDVNILHIATLKYKKEFSNLEQRLQPGGVQQTVEDLRPINVLIYRLSHLSNHICQDLTQACSTQSNRY